MKIGVILAGGKSRRFKSDIPKCLHKIDGKSIIERIIDSFKLAMVDKVYVIVNKDNYHYFDKENLNVNYLFQEKVNGTGSAFYCFNNYFNEEDQVIVVNGDCFVLDRLVVKHFLKEFARREVECGLMVKDDINNYGYGRVCVIGDFIKIKEQSELREEEKNITLINLGIYMFGGQFLKKHIEILNNDKQENKITDLLEKEKGFLFKVDNCVVCINTKKDFMLANKAYYLYVCDRLLENGVKVYDSKTTYISENVVIGKDVEIYPNSYIFGNSVIGDNTVILPNCYIEDSVIGRKCSVGPFSNLKKANVIGDECVVGAFVEMKNSKLGSKVKAKHHIYLGNVDVGDATNIGCGVITANYDGKKKHKSVIGKNCFIGSNVTLISPVNIGSNSVVAAGSTIVLDVKESSLSIARERQVNKDYYYNNRN